MAAQKCAAISVNYSGLNGSSGVRSCASRVRLKKGEDALKLAEQLVALYAGFRAA